MPACGHPDHAGHRPPAGPGRGHHFHLCWRTGTWTLCPSRKNRPRPRHPRPGDRPPKRPGPKGPARSDRRCVATKKKRFHYFIRGYRWAPENFGASKGLTKDSRKAIPLTLDERREVGILSLTKGPDAAIGYVKHTERARERQRRKIITYGFLTKESPGQFAYYPQLCFCADAPIGERLRVFKQIRDVLGENDGRVVTSTECELDGQYHPINVKENTVTADFSRPLTIPMGEKFIRDGLETPYRPRPKAPKKARPHKRRDMAPIR